MKRCLGCGTDFESTVWRCERCRWEPSASENGHLLFAPRLAESGAFDADYVFDELVAAEPRHFWFLSRRRLILSLLGRHFARAERLLDAGCGTGFILRGIRDHFPGIELAGGDLRLDALAHAARIPGAFLFQLDARTIPFSREFDVIGAFDMLEHVPEDGLVLSEMFRATRPGGGILLTVPQHAFLWSSADDFSHHQRRYSRRELTAKLTAAGFDLVYVTSFCSLLLPLLVAQRWRQRLSRAPFDPRAELRIVAVNGILDRLMRVEEAWLTRGRSLPAGGSLLAVARRPA